MTGYPTQKLLDWVSYSEVAEKVQTFKIEFSAATYRSLMNPKLHIVTWQGSIS